MLLSTKQYIRLTLLTNNIFLDYHRISKLQAKVKLSDEKITNIPN